MNENLCSFLLRAPKKFRHNNSSCLFQEFLDECEQACRGVHDREFEPTEASEISRPSVSDGSDNDFEKFSIFARHLHSLTQLERTEILQTLTNISIYNAYCTCPNFLWCFPYELSEKAKMAKDKGINLSVILSNQAPGVLNIPQCTHDIPLVYSWYLSGVLNTPPVYS